LGDLTLALIFRLKEVNESQGPFFSEGQTQLARQSNLPIFHCPTTSELGIFGFGCKSQDLYAPTGVF
jgi:hypothetical protein